MQVASTKPTMHAVVSTGGMSVSGRGGRVDRIGFAPGRSRLLGHLNGHGVRHRLRAAVPRYRACLSHHYAQGAGCNPTSRICAQQAIRPAS